jgi:predicted TIM-barrel fold metal-dependent hydrolase
MLIADAQIHLWLTDTPARPWPAGRTSKPHRPGSFTKDDALKEMDAAGVTRAVIVPPSWEGDRNDVGLEAARVHPDRFAVMGRFDIQRPDNRGLLDGWRRQPGMLGLRFTFGGPVQSRWLEDGTADWLWPAVERAGLPLMLSVPGSLAHVDRIAERHPGLKIIVDHMGLLQGKKDDAAFEFLPELLALAKRSNVAVKASALPSYSTESYPYRGLHGHIRRAFDAFGPRRMFWGTDLTRLPCSYRQAVTMFTEELPWLSASDQEWVMGRGLCEWLAWPMPGK